MEEINVNIYIHELIAPLMGALMTNAYYANKLWHLQRGTPRTDDEITAEIFETLYAQMCKVSENISKNLGVRVNVSKERP